MTETPLSTLTLQFTVPDGRPDWPALDLRVDGDEIFERVAPDWHGFDPADMLGPESPLVPAAIGSRVALYRCSCRVEGCGVIAPLIVASADGRRISWIDFRDYVGVFTGPRWPAGGGGEGEGTAWDLPEVHFAREQYLEEVERVTRERSWETPARQTARLIYERLQPLGLVVPRGLALRWISPAWDQDGVALSFDGTTTAGYEQQLLVLSSGRSEPVEAARDMADQLLAVPPDDWTRVFGRTR